MPPTLQKLHVRLLKSHVRRVDSALDEPRRLSSYALRSGLGFDGRLYVSPPNEGPPKWLQFVRNGIAGELREIENRTNAAVLLIRRGRRIFAFTFGHGRYLLREDQLEQDFGLRTALNSLRHDNLRSIDSFAIEEQTVHKRSQASRASGLEVFGVDVGRDILRAVTGVPLATVPFKSVSGSGETLAINVRTNFEGLGPLTDTLLTLYRRRTYKEHFSWVDNIRRVSDPAVVASLNDQLLQDLRTEAPQSYLAPPEPIEWDSIREFEYTYRRGERDSDMTLVHYLEQVETRSLSVDTLARHKVFAFGDDDEAPARMWPVFKCLVFEVAQARGRYVLTAGEWFEVDRAFSDRVRRGVTAIGHSTVDLPRVRDKGGGKLETEPEYNRRVAHERATMALLDRRPARCEGATSNIEVCDLLTTELELVHVKHRKGGSSSLSHLFAQGRLSAEALLRDAGFRRDARRLLRDLHRAWERRIPLGKPDAHAYQVVFAVLGTDEAHPAERLPFFSQLNLVRTYEALTALGYRVGIQGVPIAA